ncbi:hypothetical protein B484DRAFT_445292 [Ochromonadaceae sp. CCMP2298]|nr:hypothetical protein B484DRAFT_445292 [Ochromonadaceae sp. CCMP2298]
MNGLRHNPYVGSFHGINSHMTDQARSRFYRYVMMEDSKSNPLVGVFRHSPEPSKSLGLKSILYDAGLKPPALSQMQVSRETKQFPTQQFLRSLRTIPTHFYASSACSKSSLTGSRKSVETNLPESMLLPESNEAHEAPDDYAPPMCSICIEPYKDGDELRTLACQHCFHNECVSKWIIHHCLSSSHLPELSSFNCPECRQNHVTLSEAGSSSASLAEGISGQSFLQVGETLVYDVGYDFLSDFGSEIHSSKRSRSPRLEARDATNVALARSPTVKSVSSVASAQQLESPVESPAEFPAESPAEFPAESPAESSAAAPAVRQAVDMASSEYSVCGVPLPL